MLSFPVPLFRPPTQVLRVPSHVQRENFTCGPACVRSALLYYRLSAPSEETIALLAATTPEDGTNPENVAKAATLLGLESEVFDGMTLDQLAAHLQDGSLVVLSLQAWGSGDYESDWNSGHYAIAVGMSEDRVYFRDPSSTPMTWLTIRELEERWHDKEEVRRYQVGIVLRGPAPLYSVGPVTDAVHME